MDNKKDNTSTEYLIETKRQFNEFQSQSRARMESTVKFVLVVSGGMLTLSIGAVLGKPEPNIPPELVSSLKYSWGFLFYSIASSLFLMFTVLAATFHMGNKWFDRIDKQLTSTEKIKTWDWLRYFIITLGSSAVFSCICGVGLMAYVAIGIIGGL